VKLLFACDLHLPKSGNAVQYRVLSWIRECAARADALIFSGDFTASGESDAAVFFTEQLQKLSCQTVILAGNSDCRNENTTDAVLQLQSPEEVNVSRGNETVRILALHDASGSLSADSLALADTATPYDIVTFHHRPESAFRNYRLSDTAVGYTAWRTRHPDTRVFYGHIHYYSEDKNNISLLAADPDKAIGEEPGIVWYDTVTKTLTREHFPCPLPDFSDWLGISCYHPLEDIPYATEKHLGVIELRSNAAYLDSLSLLSVIEDWRKSGGRVLSVHAPEIHCHDGIICGEDEWEKFIDFFHTIRADRMTLHVPEMPIDEADENLCHVAAFAAERINRLPKDCVIGIENMHMIKRDTPEHHRYGYLPDECRRYVSLLRERCPEYTVGFHLDIGHARNNRPFSQPYTLGEWYAEIGGEVNGYHVHQMTPAFENHTPITELYGKMISLASFFAEWRDGNLAHAPVILEIRGDYRESAELLSAYRND